MKNLPKEGVVEKYIIKNFKKPVKGFQEEIAKKYGVYLTRYQIYRVLKGATLKLEEIMASQKRDPKGRFLKSTSAREQVEADRLLGRLKEGKRETDKKYKVILREVTRLETERDAILAISEPVMVHKIKPHTKHSGGEATCVVVASDFHLEERVTSASVNGMNEYSLSIAEQRSEEFFKVALHLRNLEVQNTPVPTMVLACLGDFITGNIHEENLAVCSLPPVEAAIEAKRLLKNGIDFLLANSDLKLVIPCHMGNHSRITKRYRSSETEAGNSLELFVYSFLAQEYRNDPRVEFLISKSYTSLLQIYDTRLRLHHGHRIRYHGGTGGLGVPMNKYTLRANTAWTADYDIFGHFHQAQFGPRLICNGSLIGYNAYAQDNAFEFEPPSQTYFLINKRWKQIIDYRRILFSV